MSRLNMIRQGYYVVCSGFVAFYPVTAWFTDRHFVESANNRRIVSGIYANIEISSFADTFGHDKQLIVCTRYLLDLKFRY